MPSESALEHFTHRALEVWSALYPIRLFGHANKNIILYSMAAMLYVRLNLIKKVEWPMLVTKKKDDKMEYGHRDVPDNFGTSWGDAKVGATVVVHGANPSNSSSIEASHDKDSMDEVICFENRGPRSK